jgi:hypothetical protein
MMPRQGEITDKMIAQMKSVLDQSLIKTNKKN